MLAIFCSSQPNPLARAGGFKLMKLLSEEIYEENPLARAGGFKHRQRPVGMLPAKNPLARAGGFKQHFGRDHGGRVAEPARKSGWI